MRSEALFDFVDIDHYVMPTLHLMLGIVNYLYKKMVDLEQTACEGYPLDYVEAEMIWELSKYDAATAKTNNKTFQATNGQYERQPHGVDGWYVGPSLAHYRCYSCYIPSTAGARDAILVDLFPH